MHCDGNFLEQHFWRLADRELVQIIAHRLGLCADNRLELGPRELLLDDDLGEEQHEQEDLDSLVGQELVIF